MPKEKKISQKPEILLSVLVVSILLEIFHSAILSSDLGISLNNAFIFGQSGNNLIAVLTSVAILIIISVYVKKRHISPAALIFVFSGAVTNILDRLIHGGTIDYIHLFNIPVFNIPDVFIILGLTIFFYEIAS